MSNLTNRQIISDITSDLRANNLDDKVSKRHILQKLRGFAALFIKRDTDARRLLNISDIWTEVCCVELEKVPLIECTNIDIPSCQYVMRTKSKVPETYETMYKELLEVHNPLYAKEFRQITPKDYKNILSREFQDKRIKYFWLSNGYLVIPDSLVEVVTLRGAFINPSEAMKLSGQSTDECISFLDQPFNCPDYLVAVVKSETIKDLYNFYKRTVVDENPNLNTNIKVNERQ